MSKVDWSLAPDDATHFGRGEDCSYWAKIVGSQQYFINITAWDNGKWKEATERYEEAFLTARPSKKWPGPEDGLPPVGERVEVLWSSITGEYVDAMILAHDEDRAVFRFVTGERKGEYQADKLHFSGVKLWPNFRPIKTAEQIASDKRETAIRELMDIAQVDCRVTAARLVDAGFKREVV